MGQREAGSGVGGIVAVGVGGVGVGDGWTVGTAVGEGTGIGVAALSVGSPWVVGVGDAWSVMTVGAIGTEGTVEVAVGKVVAVGSATFVDVRRGSVAETD